MEPKEDEISLDSNIPETYTEMSTPIEKDNLKVRRRNVIETINFASKEENTSDSESNVPLVRMSDSTKAWYDDIIPEIPDIVEYSLSEPLTNRERMKISVIRGSVVNPNLTLGELKLLGCSSEGLVNDDIRRILWPKLLRLSEESNFSVTELETIHSHIPNEVYQQILKDVARSGSHISQDATQHEIDHFQEQLTQLMCWVLHKHSVLKLVLHVYYQGYNDIAATVLLVMGLQNGLHVLESISLEFLERFMEKTMEKVICIINIYIIYDKHVFYIMFVYELYIESIFCYSVELFPHFALAEYTTWYAHKYAENRKLLHRLFDYFLGSPPLMPLYLSTVIVAYRATEIFNTTPDMGHTHKVLCTLPDDLPFETLLVEAKNLYRQYPPESISNDVTEYDRKRKCKEQEWKAKAEASRQEREKQRQLRIIQSTRRIPYRIRSYKTITVVTILALGLYAFLRSSSGLN
ncbi:TBC1 domain family member 20 [Melipona quadrifasciata]|uniref:TBC1 domain family member 20 n=1 Tax=Melipona quadrifasciata TaxID=166423 RepID=A0A0M9A324_9HYME|nr:TBC1 domain family member 20 [Melipona quadrifasciata]